ncbi:MAG: TOBE domain-containing protein [Thermoproteota archaeon]
MLVGVRPEDIEISFEKKENSLKAVVDISEPLGISSILNVVLNRDTVIKALYPRYFDEKMLGKFMQYLVLRKYAYLFKTKNNPFF